MDYLALLEHSLSVENEGEIAKEAKRRLEYLSNFIFDFTTYDSDIDALFARYAVEVCRAISGVSTFAYIADPEQYRWYIVMCNMPFFAGRLNWGTSIRGAWWDIPPELTKLHCCGLWVGNDQLLDLDFTRSEWEAFIAALIAFAAPEMAVKP